MPKPVTLGRNPVMERFSPFPEGDPIPVYIEPAELEALRLVDLEGLSQEEAGEKMGVSRGTVWRLLQSARKKSAQVLTEARPLQVSTEENETE